MPKRLAEHLLHLGPAYTQGERTGDPVVTATEGIEKLDAYVSRYLPQAALGVAVPVLIVLATLGTFLARSAMGVNYHNYPIWLIVPLATLVMIVLQFRFWAANADLYAWATSAGLLLLLLASTGIGVYPDLLPSNPHPERSLTIHNSYSSVFAMQVGLTWLVIGLVLALAHVSWVYYLFKGKVRLEAGSHY